MNDKFYKLPKDKQLAIINAGFEFFGKFDYKKASTEQIANKANISKGLLFYYFRNKEEFFKYLYLYAQNCMEEKVYSSNYKKTNDFFEALEIITEVKCSLLKESPYILQFLVTAQCSNNETVNKVIKNVSDKLASSAIQDFIKNINFSKFNEEINPTDIIEMLAFSLDGYLQNKLRNNEPIILEDIMKKYKVWTKILMKSSYC